MKKLIYTLHSLERLKQRKIIFNQIENCLNNPDKTIIIITAYKTSKIKKYLQ